MTSSSYEIETKNWSYEIKTKIDPMKSKPKIDDVIYESSMITVDQILHFFNLTRCEIDEVKSREITRSREIEFQV